MMAQKKRILLYSPHDGIALFSATESKLASHLQKSGYEVFTVSCHRTLRPYCATMSAHALNQDSSDLEKNRICRKCEKSVDYVTRKYQLNSFNMHDFLTIEDLAKVQEILSEVTKENFMDLQVLGVPAGRKALYEFLLQYKKSDYEFNDKEWRHYKIGLEGAIKSLITGSRIVDKVQPHAILCYNPQYAANGMIDAYAKNKNIPVYFIHNGLNLSRSLKDLMLAMAPAPDYYKRVANAWARFKDVPLKTSEVNKVLGHFRELFNANSVFVYSSPTTRSRPEVRKLYSIKPEQNVIVATMSSYDERFAAEGNLTLKPVTETIFKSQIEWIKFLVDYVKSKPDLFLLIRVHPREFPNKRERVKSQHAEKLEKIFNALPANVQVNWPTDQISLYHLAEEASVFLNAWSSVGKEMTALGRPVVLYSKELPFYATDINYIASSTEEYIRFIHLAIEKPFDFNRVIQSFRLINLEFHRALLDMTSFFNEGDLYPKIKWLRRIEGKLLKYTSSIRQLKRLCKKEAVLDDAEALDLVLDNPGKDIVDFRPSDKITLAEEEKAALFAAFKELFQRLYPMPIKPERPDTSLYVNMKNFLEW